MPARLKTQKAAAFAGNGLCKPAAHKKRWDTKMLISGESLLIILAVGLIAGWLAGLIVRGTGFGIVSDLVIGVLGAFFGSWLFPQIGVHFGAGLVAAVINATLGALLLLLVISFFRRGSGWRGNWRRGW